MKQLSKNLINKHNLKPAENEVNALKNQVSVALGTSKMLSSSCLIIITAAASTYISALLNMILMISMIYFFGCMFACGIVRNVIEVSNLFFHLPEIYTVGSISLDFFLALTLMTLDLTKLVNADVPMLDILLTETVLMALWAYFITFKFCGNNFNEAVMVAGN
ncbi:MAG TPA: sodium/glutamate symporter [Anaerovoracaceae bacterium]|nr:sodium/glutamate symporter [Anaerovoracaceae bacterium]